MAAPLAPLTNLDVESIRERNGAICACFWLYSCSAEVRTLRAWLVAAFSRWCCCLRSSILAFKRLRSWYVDRDEWNIDFRELLSSLAISFLADWISASLLFSARCAAIRRLCVRERWSDIR